MSGLTHFDASGAAHMVDVGDKPITHRVAVAGGRIRMRPETLDTVRAGTHAKGDVLGHRPGGRDHGGQAHRRAHPAVPPHRAGRGWPSSWTRTPSTRRHRVPRDDRGARSAPASRWRPSSRLQVTLATVYDMCKAVDRGMVIESVRLLEKRGGKSGRLDRRRAGVGATPGAAVRIPHGVGVGSSPCRESRRGSVRADTCRAPGGTGDNVTQSTIAAAYRRPPRPLSSAPRTPPCREHEAKR